jgi:hypothetical protein
VPLVKKQKLFQHDKFLEGYVEDVRQWMYAMYPVGLLKEHTYAFPRLRVLEDLVAIDAITLRRVQENAMLLNAICLERDGGCFESLL